MWSGVIYYNELFFFIKMLMFIIFELFIKTANKCNVFVISMAASSKGEQFIFKLEKVTRFTGFLMGSPSLSTDCSSPKHVTLEKLYSFSYYLYAGG